MAGGKGTEKDIAEEMLSLLGTGRQVEPITTRGTGFDLPAAYRVSALVKSEREARGETAVGRKIGFTNKTIWEEYDVHAPIWNYVFDRTVDDLSADRPVELSRFPEPRLEPEIMFRFAAAPSLDMDDEELLASVEWAAHGFEIVQSLFPKWRFAAADTVAAYGLHAALRVGPKLRLDDEAVRRQLLDLSSLRIELRRNGELVDRGEGANVLDGGPLAAIRHLIGLLEQQDVHPPLAAGEVVTTGTLTRALPIAAGETWSTRLVGCRLEGATIRFA